MSASAQAEETTTTIAMTVTFIMIMHMCIYQHIYVLMGAYLTMKLHAAEHLCKYKTIGDGGISVDFWIIKLHSFPFDHRILGIIKVLWIIKYFHLK